MRNCSEVFIGRPWPQIERICGNQAPVSDLALIILAATDESLTHDGMSPQRTSDNSRDGLLAILANDRDWLSGGGIIAWTPVLLIGDAIEVFLK